MFLVGNHYFQSWRNIREYKKKYGKFFKEGNSMKNMIGENNEKFPNTDYESMVRNERPLYTSQVDPSNITMFGTADKYIPLKDNVFFFLINSFLLFFLKFFKTKKLIFLIKLLSIKIKNNKI